MADGITFDGELGSGVNGSRPQDAIEIACSNPRFLERAAQKRPNFVISLIEGAYSFPRDWWVAIIFCYMRLGVFGGDAKSQADGWADTLTTILGWAAKNKMTAGRLLRAYLRHKMETPEFYGRIGGGVFTNYASRGGRFGAKIISGPVKVASMTANFILANTGAAVLTVKYGSADIASVFDAMMTGNYRSELDSETYRRLFENAVSSSEPLSNEEADALVGLVEGILHCIDHPGDYVPSQENAPSNRRNIEMVPVGTVSSMRPAGVMGSIPRGMETNALDVISEERRLIREW